MLAFIIVMVGTGIILTLAILGLRIDSNKECQRSIERSKKELEKMERERKAKGRSLHK